MDELLLTSKALADPTRVRILKALGRGELCVCELCDALGVTQSTLSTHLQLIREAGLVETRKKGKWVYYAPHPKAESLLTALFALFESGLQRDPVLRHDARRLSRRVKERKDGLCCIGFGAARGAKGAMRMRNG
jgi:ArsR family transcriptional regulator, arsenate/arsenite/antimonite-responsive transcriptional repressor